MQTADPQFLNLFLFSFFRFFFFLKITTSLLLIRLFGNTNYLYDCLSCKHNAQIKNIVLILDNSNQNPLSPRWLTNTLVLFPVMSREFFKEEFFLHNVPFFFYNPSDSLMRAMKLKEQKTERPTATLTDLYLHGCLCEIPGK